MSTRRNEPARARRREGLKKKLSLTSMTTGKSQHDVQLNLDNHFGWQVLSKAQVGDGQFPHLTQYFEKPDIAGRDFQKVTYVLYMDKGAVSDRDEVPKTTSKTIVSRDKLVEREAPRKEKSKERPSRSQERSKERRSRSKKRRSRSKSKKKPKKLISDFYYVRKDRSQSVASDKTRKKSREKSKDKSRKSSRDKSRDKSRKRSRDKSRKRSKSRKKSKDKRSASASRSGVLYELKEVKSKRSEIRFVEVDKEKFLEQIKKESEEVEEELDQRAKQSKESTSEKVKKGGKRRKKPGSWILRAGADATNSDILTENKEETVKVRSSSVVKKDSKLMKLVNLKSDLKKSRRVLSTECLLASPSGTNKYLYVARSSCKQIGVEDEMKTTDSSESDISC